MVTEHPFLGPLELTGGAGPDGARRRALLRERVERRAACSGRSRRRRPRRTASTTTSSRARTRSAPTQRHEGVLLVHGDVAPGATGALPRPAAPAGDRRGRARGATSTCHRRASRGGRRVLRRADPGDRLATTRRTSSAGVRRDALGQAALLLRRRPLARGRSRPAVAARVAPRRPQRALAELRRRSTSCRCRTSGSTRGSRRGTAVPLRPARARRPDVRQVPARTCSAASASSTRAARCRRTSGRSTTSTRPCRLGGARASSRSTARGTPSSSARIFDKLVVNFMWWVNRKDSGRLRTCSRAASSGLDNIGPIDRSHLPPGWILEQSDATGWMAFYSLAMAAIAAVLYSRGRPATHLVHTFLRALLAHLGRAPRSRPLGRRGRLLLRPAAAARRLVHARQGPLDGRDHAARRRRSYIDAAIFERAESVDERVAALIAARQARRRARWRQGLIEDTDERRHAARRRRPRPRAADLHAALQRGARSSRRTASGPSRASTSSTRSCSTSTGCTRRSRYEPAESTTGMFGGNSNWRGPIWFPVNYLVLAALVPLRALLRRPADDRVPDRVRAEADARGDRERRAAPADLDLPRRGRTGGGRATAASSACRPTPPGRTTSSSASTSTATTAPGSGPRTRPAGQDSSPT